MAAQSLDDLNATREEEYLGAKRAAVEAVDVGRETLAESARQGEQLRNAEKCADQTRFALDKSNRILRGMTWSGWLANIVTKDIKEEEYASATPNVQPEALLSYDDVPECGTRAAQAIQNMHANLLVLEDCETDEQRGTCLLVCDDMYTKAAKEISNLHGQGDQTSQALAKRFLVDLSTLRGRLKTCKRKIQNTAPVSSSRSSAAKKEVPSPTRDPIAIQQDEHLEFISQNLGELQSIAHSLHESFSNQTKVIDSLDEKSDEILDKSKMVTRRSDRLIQKKAWTPAKKTLHSLVAIRNLATGQYIAETEGSLRMTDKFGPITCTFRLWKRPNDTFGLEHKLSGRWVGQNLVGSLCCSSRKFGAREEWQADDDWNETRLLCVSAGWGHGGYLVLRGGTLSIGKGDTEARKQADLWCLEVIETNES